MTDVNDLLRRVLEQGEACCQHREPRGTMQGNHVHFEEAHAYLDGLKQGTEPPLRVQSRLDSLEARMTAHEQGMCETPKPHVERIEKVLRGLLEASLIETTDLRQRIIARLLNDLAPPSTQEDNDG